MWVCESEAAENNLCVTAVQYDGYKQILNKDQVCVCRICVWLDSNTGGVEWLRATGAVKYATCM